MNTTEPSEHASLLTIHNITVAYPSRHGVFEAVKNVSFNVAAGEILGVVGESGAGKSTVGNAVAEIAEGAGEQAKDAETTALSMNSMNDLLNKEGDFIKALNTALDKINSRKDEGFRKNHVVFTLYAI